MQQPSRGPRQSTLRRLLIVFGLGLVGALFFSPVSLNLWWLQPAIAFMVLLIAVLIGWLIERNDRRNSGRASVGRAVISLALRVAIFFGLGGGFVVLSQIVEAAGTSTEARQMVFQWGVLAAGLVPILIGFTGALLMQIRRSGGLAMGGAAVAWLGTSVGNVVATILLPVLKPEAPNPEGIGTSLVPLIVLSVAGVALASLGGFLGWGLRALAET